MNKIYSKILKAGIMITFGGIILMAIGIGLTLVGA